MGLTGEKNGVNPVFYGYLHGIDGAGIFADA